jgi:RNA polymerase sigma factor (TIGR02999 family)
MTEHEPDEGDPAPAWPQLVADASHGRAEAHDRLFQALYAQLHRQARRALWRQGAGVSLGATTLLHETYLAVQHNQQAAFVDEAHFLAYAARAMRGLIIDHVRRRRAHKRGGLFEFTTLNTELGEETAEAQALEALSDALDTLARLDARLAELVDLKFFCGLSLIEIAKLRGVSERTAQRDWEKARLLLHHELGGVPLSA